MTFAQGRKNYNASLFVQLWVLRPIKAPRNVKEADARSTFFENVGGNKVGRAFDKDDDFFDVLKQGRRRQMKAVGGPACQHKAVGLDLENKLTNL